MGPEAEPPANVSSSKMNSTPSTSTVLQSAVTIFASRSVYPPMACRSRELCRWEAVRQGDEPTRFQMGHRLRGKADYQSPIAVREDSKRCSTNNSGVSLSGAEAGGGCASICAAGSM
ncbi:hypothetical protein GX51_00820 [Blastomyces parvus]|uniref:Uncharacterized protein n=1 Tax=Blastomyces parvus TaxID=2060905 RepID=A0A2B7XKF6_9EURO|nr:hypothetical protein GX51_00820 [Blastomyces parvus]